MYKSACVRLCGGLGNQLFQLAFGHARATAGNEVCFDAVNGFLRDPYRRVYALDDFQFSIRKARSKDIPWGMGWPSPFHRVAKGAWNTVSKRYRQVYYEKRPFAYEPEAVDLSNNARYFWGYWQNPSYVEPVADAFRNKLRLKIEKNEFGRLRQEIGNRSSLSIHVRRYRDLDKGGKVIASARGNHGVCEVSYYHQAVQAIPDYAHQHAYIFSDDPVWAKSNLRLPIQSSCVADRHSFTAAEELMLMAACKNHVISNSSFSWWAAWLGSNADKTVVAPKVWNKKLGGNQSTVCPSSWIRL